MFMNVFLFQFLYFITHFFFPDTENLYTVATNLVTEPYGKKYTWDIKVQVMGKTSVESAEYVIKALDLPLSTDEYINLMEEKVQALFPTCKLLPGVARVIRHLHKHKVPIAIATSSKTNSFLLKTQNHSEFVSLFNHVVCGSDDPEVLAGKPAPDTFLVCAQRFDDKPPPDKVLVFEDSPNGVEAAVAAGMQVIMIPDPRVDPKQCKLATLVLKSMEDFKPEMFGLPAIA